MQQRSQQPADHSSHHRTARLACALPRSTRARLASRFFAAAACALVLAPGCASQLDLPLAPVRYYAAARDDVLRASVEILRSRGYQLADALPESSVVVGEMREILRRTRGSFFANTEVLTRVVLEIEPHDAGTDIRASFEIIAQQPGGQTRRWVSATPPCEKLRREFYASLDDELGDDAVVPQGDAAERGPRRASSGADVIGG